MEIRKISAVYFSPGGTTRRLVETLAEEVAAGYPGAEYAVSDVTLPEGRREPFHADGDELAVVGLPVYAGRLPNLLLDDLERWQGEGTWAVPVVTYGNRSFGSALAELRDLLLRRGFRPLAAAAFVGQHAFAGNLAPGRPDDRDFALARSFARRITRCLHALTAEEARDFSFCLPGEEQPGYGGYYQPLGEDGQPVRFLKAKPVTSERCTGCGLCAEVCPMGAVNPCHPQEVPGICIKCNACIKACPQGAKQITDEGYLSHRRFLENRYAAVRAACALFGMGAG